MESALEVLSRAATMVNTNSDNRLSINKELPTTKWRRDRRIRLSSEYHHGNHETAVATPTVLGGATLIKPLGESNQSNSISDNNSMEIPLDMSVGAASKPPPPPYREPLPGSTFCTMSRPSVITQAPKREVISNQENKQMSSPSKKPMVVCNDDINPPATESISMIDAVIDEHFRRSLGSLGADYMNLFGKRLNQLKLPSSVSAAAVAAAAAAASVTASAAATTPTTPAIVRKSAQLSPVQVNSPESVTQKSTSPPHDSNRPNENGSKLNVVPAAISTATAEKEKKSGENVEMSVDDHFAKALGDTWKQLQQHGKSRMSPVESDHEIDSANNSNVNESKVNEDDGIDDDDDDDDDDERPMLEIDTSNDIES